MTRKPAASTPAQVLAAQDAAKRAAKKSRRTDDSTLFIDGADVVPVFEEVQEMLRMSGPFGAFLSECDDEPDVELEAKTVGEAVLELIEHYGREIAPGPGTMRFEQQQNNGRWRLSDDCTLEELLKNHLDISDNEMVQLHDPHMHVHVRVTMRKPATVRKRKGGKKFSGNDELWFDGYYAGLKKMGPACVSMNAETRAGDVVRSLYAHYGATLPSKPRFTFKEYEHGPEDPNPLIMPMWEQQQRITEGLDLPLGDRMFRALTVIVGPEPLQAWKDPNAED
ncbi:hypothetical protein CcaverHIS641_0607430 [Cutaneotrichosporon cavernicola]|nr:hypothetical protein CcaverHIS641_0607430 [Cutaneotrichosporon cavernicola]